MRILRFLPVVCLLLFAGCAGETPTPSTPVAPVATAALKFPKDDLGRDVNLKSPAKRVVCIGPGATETIFALGAGAQLVGCDQVSDYPAAALKVPIVGDYTGPFIEKVIAARPDLVIVQGETYDRARAENWQAKIGAPVAILVPTSMEKVGGGMRKIGEWIGHTDVAKKISAPLTNIPYPDFIHRSAIFEVQRSPLWAAGNRTLYNDIISYFGMSNLPPFSGYKQYSTESLMAKQPDIYIVTESAPNRARAIQTLRGDSILGKLECVKKGQVIVLHSDYILRPGPRLLLGLKEFEQQRKLIFPKESVSRMHSIMN